MATAVRPRSEHTAPALLSPSAARLIGFVPLVALGALEWARMVEAGPGLRPLTWVLVAVGAVLAVLACDRLPGRLRLAGTVAAAVFAVLVAALVAGLDPVLLKPARWDQLGSGIARGVETLGAARLPYDGADPWPDLTLALSGALLCVVAGLVAVWPRASGRGFPFIAWALLLVLAASPVVSLGGSRPVVLGSILTVLSILFLWLERLPLRPGLGAALLAGIALVGALPLGAAADRDTPWFNYKAFADGFGGAEPIRFSWNHDYEPLRWPRDGRELFRVVAQKPAYLKAETLDYFDGDRWRAGGASRPEDVNVRNDLVPGWQRRTEWTGTARVFMRRLRSFQIVAPGTVLDVPESSRRVRPSVTAGSWVATRELRRGDSYRVHFYAPQPRREQLARAGTAGLGLRTHELTVRVPLPVTDPAVPQTADGVPAPDADVAFAPFGSSAKPVALYGALGREGSGDAALRMSPYARSWRLAQRLKRGTATPLDYVVAVDSYLERGFTYSERPPSPAFDREPIDAFLFDTHSGYCQHFSGAMALLLRMGGIPARVASGFSPGGRDRRRGEWVVRNSDAHSWVEAWFSGIGWVTLDPTPPATPARSLIVSLQIDPASPSSADDPAAADADGQEKATDSGSEKALDPRRTDAAAQDIGGTPWGWVIGGVAALLAVAAAGLVLQRRAATGREMLVDRSIAELETALRHTGRPAPRGITLVQLERRLGLTGEASAYVSSLRAGRYGRTTAPPTRKQRRALRRQLGSGLGLRGRVRALRALPPWRV